MAVESIQHAIHSNYDINNTPIAIHTFIIRRGIINNREYGLEQKLKDRFSKYGKIWSYDLSGKMILFFRFIIVVLT